jgi:uncharacterized membrane protein YdbT with pleckstrin-like domain
MSIRVVPNETVPVSVYKYLLPHERQVITVRFHPAVLLRPVTEVLGGLAIAILISMTIAHGNITVILIVWLVWLVLAARFMINFFLWLESYFIITTQRLLLATGIFTRTVNMLPLSKVTDMSFRRSAAGRLLGYGEFIVESAGLDQAMRRVDHLPYPEQLYLEVCGLIFKDKGDDGD